MDISALNASGAGNVSFARRTSLAQQGGGDGVLGVVTEEDADAAEKAAAVKAGMLHAWRGYERFAMVGGPSERASQQHWAAPPRGGRG